MCDPERDNTTSMISLNYQGGDPILMKKRCRRVSLKVALFCCMGVALIIGVPILLHVLNVEPFGYSNKIPCAEHLRDIGLACLIYANSNSGKYPEAFEDLVLATGVPPETFVCPKTNDFPSPGKTKAQQASHLSSGGHLSYIYVGKGLNVSVPNATDVVVAYEPLSNHGGTGSWFLFADGHVEFKLAKDAAALIAAIPATQPTAAP